MSATTLAEPSVDLRWSDRFAARTRGMTSSAIRELLKLTEQPDIISFAGGLPAPEVFPLAEVKAAANRVLEEHGASALQYGTTEGYLPLREMLVRHMGRYGIRVTPANVMVTSGAQQALDLVGKVLLDPGDRIVTEEPTFLGAIQAFTSYEACFLTVPIDDDGMQVHRLEEALKAGAKLIYVLPNFQNPAGVTLSLKRRHLLVELAARYGVPIIEDDPYGQLRYEGRHLPPLVKLDADYHGCAHGERSFRGGVLYLGTFSKTLAPGFRLGWIVAPEEVLVRLVQAKQAADLHTSSFCQHVAFEAARGGFLDRHVRVIRHVYGERRDAMLRALAAHFPATARWTRPQGGLFLWVSLPAGIDSEELLQDALDERVAFVPGRSFYPHGEGAGTFRLNYSYCTPSRIEEGIRRLGRVLRRRL
ncbi:MAG TPA: PLP-dependent aminotransferase family protein [Vicinamibacteria bacterium]|nr:PLP-dependent aminotransferase family protein [Vicinamibacteria bacterium]